MTTTPTPGPWRYEEATKTIRAVPGNHWLASIDSWDGAIDHAANAALIAAAPTLLAAAEAAMADLDHYVSTHGPGPDRRRDALRAAIAAARGEDA